LTATAQASTSLGTTFQDSFTHTLGTACAGVTTNLSLTKTSAGSGLPGSTLVSTLTAHDLSGLGAGGFQFVESVPALATYDAAASSPLWSCTGSGGPGSTCRTAATNVPANGSLSAFFAVTLDATFPAGTQAIANTVCGQVGPSSVVGCATSTTPTAGAGVLHVTKTHVSGSGAPGGTIVFQLTASNTGNQGLASVTLSETVPAATSFAPAASDPGWSCIPGLAAGASCTLSVGALSAGASSAHNFAVTVADPLPAGTSAVANTACAHDPAATTACDTASVPTTGTPLLKLSKSLGSGTGAPGSTLVYNLTVTNSGNEGASGVTLHEAPPTDTAFDAAASSPGWSCGGSPATCSLTVGGLNGGATTLATFAVTLPPTLPAGVTALTNVACATWNEASSPSCDSLTVPTAGRASLQLVKSYLGGPVTAGLLLPYQLTLSNGGNQDAAGVTLHEVVPARTSFVAASSSPGWTCTPGAGSGASCALAVGSLAAGASVTLSFNLVADNPLPPGLLTVANSACAADLANDQGCGSIGTPAPVSLVASLRDAIGGNFNPLAHAGDRIDYTLVVGNPSAGAADSVVVATSLDPYLALEIGSVTTTVGAVTAGNTSGAAVPVVSIPSLVAGAMATITFSAHVAAELPADLRQVSAQASLTGSNIEPTVSDDPDTPAPLDPTATPIAPPPPPPAPTAIPTLGVYGLVSLALLLAVGGWPLVRKHRARP
jgi:uncharacterized repeat protein (TIGR01451 family)